MNKIITTKMRAILGFSVAMFAFIGCTTEDNFVERTVQSNVYSNTSIGLSITFPQNWLLKTDEVYKNRYRTWQTTEIQFTRLTENKLGRSSLKVPRTET